jgi:DNA helicase-2/ATP-dependent DNA helicase PcrA
VPFVKFGGLKFLDAAHVKDFLCLFRWTENPRDRVAGFRVLQLLPGIGPGIARKALDRVERTNFVLDRLDAFRVPAAAAAGADWPAFVRLLGLLQDSATDWRGQINLARQWYEPQLERLYDGVAARASDLAQLEQIAGTFHNRRAFLEDLTLDPPDATGDESGAPLLDEDYLVLSTIHSAKGQEWKSVYVLNVVDGCIPSDLGVGSPAEIEEERRLLYVAMTRARDDLHLVHPHRFYVQQQRPSGDRHVYAPRSRFITAAILPQFESVAWSAGTSGSPAGDGVRVDLTQKLRQIWGQRS